MKAISLVPGTTHIELTEAEEPTIQQPDEVKIKVWQVGICGTDREEAEGGGTDPPDSKSELIIGRKCSARWIIKSLEEENCSNERYT